MEILVNSHNVEERHFTHLTKGKRTNLSPTNLYQIPMFVHRFLIFEGALIIWGTSSMTNDDQPSLSYFNPYSCVPVEDIDFINKEFDLPLKYL